MRSFFVFPVFLSAVVSAGAPSVWAQGTRLEPPLKVSLAGEEPSGVYFDRDTLDPQTPLLFTARIENPSTAPREVNLHWKITDSQGRVRLERDSKFRIAGGDSIVRRELFDASSRGGYLLETRASSKLRGPDTSTATALPFAIAVAPAPGSGAARPRSFFVLSAPPRLSNDQLDFYSRLGARVLRSSLLPDPARPDWSAVEAQLGARLKRNLTTIALLPLGSREARRSEALWARQVPATLARYGSLSTWELQGDVAPADLDAWAQLARARRADVSLLGPLPSEGAGVPGASLRLSGLAGATFEWPSWNAHPAALRRLWLSRAAATQGAGVSSFHLRRDIEDGAGSEADTPVPEIARAPQQAISPGDAAGEMVADYLSAIMAGASSMSETLSPPGFSLDPASAMARGAAFSMLSRTLEDASFREELFPRSPAFEGALFRAPRGSIGVLYAPLGAGKMRARLSPARAYDLFGNLLASDRDGVLEIPLSGQPVYVLAPVPSDVLGFALRGAQIAGIQPLAAQFLPLSRVPGESAGSTAVRVRLQNIGLGQQSGQIRLNAPTGWKLATSRYDYRLGEGESKTYEFRVTTAPLNPKWSQGRVPLGVAAGGRGGISFEADVPIASALPVAGSEAPKLDGDLSDWSGSVWQSAGPNREGVRAKVALKWGAGQLYIAAQVRENNVAARRLDETSYEFWRGHDALQIAFGTSDAPESVPSRAPFRDSDQGFLLSPFAQSGPSDYEGRVLKLWGPGQPFGTAPDRVRWGGVLAGSSCVIARDEKEGLTTYEARLPLSALPEVSPRALGAKDGAVRFGWLLHNDEGAPLDWGRNVGNFPWWSNTSTFLPDGELTSPLRATLGFTPARADAPSTVPAPVSAPSSPATLLPPAPAPVATRPAPSFPSTSVPAPSVPLLPPAPAAGATPLLPAPPTSSGSLAPFPIPAPAAPPVVVAPSTAPLPNLPPPSGPLGSNQLRSNQIAPFIVPRDGQPLPPSAPR